MAILMTKMQKNYHLLKHLKNRGPAAGDEDQARNAAVKIANHLKTKYDATLYGVGSLFLPGRTFTKKSDIDLVVKGLPASKFFSIVNEVNEMTEYEVDLIPWEDANEYLRSQAEEEGRQL